MSHPKKALKADIRHTQNRLHEHFAEHQAECWAYVQDGPDQLLEIRIDPDGNATTTPCDLSGTPLPSE